VRDLLALEGPEHWAPRLLPEDETIGGFDTIGGALSLSPMLLDRYLSAARSISRLAVGDRTIGPAFASQTYEAAQTTFQHARMSDDHPFGSRGGLAIRHRFPLDAEYVLRVRLRRNVLGYVRGLHEPHTLEVRLDRRLIAQRTIGGDNRHAPAPLGFTGVFLGDPAWEEQTLNADRDLEVRFHATAGPHLLAVSFVDELYEVEGVLQPPLTGLGLGFSEFSSAPTGPWGPAVDAVSIEGPYEASGAGDTPSRRRLFSCHPSSPALVGDRPGADGSGAAARENACAQQILSTLARRAYRGLATDNDVARLLERYRAERAAGRGTFEDGIRAGVERALVDPKFLFRVERDPPGVAPGAVYPIGDIDLASRLSFFLWSSIPDDRLLDLAAQGALGQPSTLASEVKRLLRDERSASLVDRFAVQWLTLGQLRPVTLDSEIFTEYDGNLRDAFLRETTLFFEDQLRADRSVLELVTARHTFVNERLAEHYGMSGVYGSHFRRVPVGEERAGLLAHGSILTATSYPTRTSPVLRGRWLLDTIFGAPPPPPPPDIPALPSRGARNERLTMRQRTVRHRTSPACAGCHVRMDPLGFALEPFDAIGRLRDTDETGDPIDATAVLPDGTRFTGLAGLRTLVTGDPETFVRTLTAKLMTYALGRLTTDADRPAIDRVVAESARDGYRWSAIIQGIVSSVPFQTRQTAGRAG
jgi:hypothetical protein